MINVCFFSGDITRSGGTERVSTVLANELQKDNDLNVSFLSLWENHSESFYYIDESINRSVLFNKESTGFYRFISYVRRIRKFIKKNNIDVLIDIDGILDMYSIPALFKLKTKLISWEQFNFYNNPYVNYRKLTRKMAAKWADAIVVITKEDKGYYEENLIIRHTIEQIYNPMTIEISDDSYDLNSKTILSIGRMTEQKGFDMLPDISKGVFDKHPDWNWIIIGDGEDKQRVIERIKEYGLESNISIINNVKNIEDYYKKSALYVMTSRYEGFGLVLTEAQAYHLPCISFRCPAGPSEIIRENENGLLVDCLETGTMTNEINRLIESNELRKKYSDNALKEIGRFYIKNISKQWISLIKEL